MYLVPLSLDQDHNFHDEQMKRQHFQLQSINSGMVDKGKDLGSSLVKNIPRQRIGVLIGAETSSLSAGEIWHFFEQEIKLGVSLIMEEDLSSALDEIDVLFIPEGDYTPDFPLAISSTTKQRDSLPCCST